MFNSTDIYFASENEKDKISADKWTDNPIRGGFNLEWLFCFRWGREGSFLEIFSQRKNLFLSVELTSLACFSQHQYDQNWQNLTYLATFLMSWTIF